MMSLHYFIDPFPVPFIPSAALMVELGMGAGMIACIVLYVIARQARHIPPRKRLLMRYARWLAGVVIGVGLLFFFRQQRVYFLSMPLIAVVFVLSEAAWLAHLIVQAKSHKNDIQRWQEQLARKKYLS